MKKTLLLLSLTALIFSCTQTQTPQEPVPTWEENFDVDGVIDTTYWTKIGRGTADWNNYMSDYDSLFEVKDGNLVLHGIQNTVLPDDTAAYLTGGIFTKNKLGFTRGRIEIRAKFTSSQGAWPAIWMLPQGVKWPFGGEIDIMEHPNLHPYVFQTTHSHYTYNLGFTEEPRHNDSTLFNSDIYNIYALELHQDSICYFLNGEHTHTYPRIETEEEMQFPFDDQPYYLLIDQQLGGFWTGEVDPTALPATMWVDWVRFYAFEDYSLSFPQADSIAIEPVSIYEVEGE